MFEMVLGDKIVSPLENNQNPADSPKKIEGPELPYNHEAIDNMRQNNNILMLHWDTCKFKSDVMEYEVKSCCHGTERRRGICCTLLGTLDLNPMVCSLCSKYQAKPEE